MEQLTNFQIVLEHNRRTMTRHEWLSFKQTDAYKRFAGEMSEREYDMKRAKEAWGMALDMSRSILEPKAAEQGVVLPERLVERLAEKLLVEQQHCPPTYTGAVECESCGVMPSHPSHVGKQAWCAWCDPTRAEEIAG